VKAFVTGATGFVGSHLVDALRAAGHEVVCLVRDPAKAQRVFGGAPPRIVRGDLFDTEAVALGAADADVVFHVAGLIAARTIADFYAINRDATAGVLAAVRRTAPRLSRWTHPARGDRARD
jgi:nucleoside-diphosphate-sugar epimerase